MKVKLMKVADLKSLENRIIGFDLRPQVVLI